MVREGGDVTSRATFSLEGGNNTSHFDEDGHKRLGTLFTTSAKVITAIVGSGILSLAWVVAQLGPISGTIALLIVAAMAWRGASLLADCYFVDTESGKINCTYGDAAKEHLGKIEGRLCGIAQYVNLVGLTIGYTITASISMAAIERSSCFHKQGQDKGCHTSNNRFMIIFGVIQIILSQLPDFQKYSMFSIMDVAISLAYTCIILGLAVAKVSGGGHHAHTSLRGTAADRMDKVCNTFSAIADIAFAYNFSHQVFEIQDTLKSSDPQRDRVIMKRATRIGILISTILYLSCALMGYMAFGDDVPDNLLTGFGFFEPFWLVDLANFCVVVHLMVSYQVYCKPIFESVEKWKDLQWPGERSIAGESVNTLPHQVRLEYYFICFRIFWRTAYVVLITILAMMFPFFNDLTGLFGAALFWPLSVYFPIKMFIARENIRKASSRWIWMQILSCVCLVVSLLAAAASLRGIIISLKGGKFFNSVS